MANLNRFKETYEIMLNAAKNYRRESAYAALKADAWESAAAQLSEAIADEEKTASRELPR